MELFEYAGKQYRYQLKLVNRKSISLTVKPNLKLVVRAPEGTRIQKVQEFIKKKISWIEKQILFFKKYEKRIYEKEYISGTSIWYLGRQYKLVVKESVDSKIVLGKNILQLYSTKSKNESRYNKYLLDRWYREQRYNIFSARFKEMIRLFDYKVTPTLDVKFMSKRWGSFINTNKIVLNPRLIYTSTDCIDYVIVHELCHIKHKNHNKQFFELLSKKFPRWQEIKEKLELSSY